MNGKVSIIGGAGRVGSNAAYALQCGRSGAEIVLVDVAADVARGEALDLTHGRAAVGGPRISAGDYGAVAGSDLVIVTAGLRRKPEESRLQLIERNVSLFRQLVGSVQQLALPADAILLVVANPVDVLTYLAGAELGWAQERTIGLGTVLDTQRFLSLLGERIGVDPSHLTGFILGEHGDSMVPAYSTLHHDGAPLASVPGYSEAAARETFEATRTAGAECLRLKGGAGYAVGLAIRQVVEAILGDTGAVLPVSTIHRGDEYGETAFSLPTRVGRSGVQGFAEVALTEEERRGVKGSAEVLAQTIAGVRGVSVASAVEAGSSPPHADHAGVAPVPGSPTVYREAGSFTADGVTLRGIATFHDTKHGQERGPNLVWAVCTEGLCVCHLGDLGMVLDAGHVKAVGPIDVLLVPVGGTFTIDYAGAIKVIGLLKPRLVIPMHYRTPKVKLTLDYVENFLKELRGDRTKTIREVDGSDLQLTTKDLPRQGTEIVVLKPAL